MIKKMTTDIILSVTDMAGYNFVINLNWDIDVIKQSICTHYETKLFNDFLSLNDMSKYEYYKNSDNAFLWLKSDLHKVAENYYYDDIELIYNNEKLEQYHVECDLFTRKMIKQNNNISFIITKKDRPSENDYDDDNNDDYDTNYDEY